MHDRRIRNRRDNDHAPPGEAAGKVVDTPERRVSLSGASEWSRQAQRHNAIGIDDFMRWQKYFSDLFAKFDGLDDGWKPSRKSLKAFVESFSGGGQPCSSIRSIAGKGNVSASALREYRRKLERFFGVPLMERSELGWCGYVLTDEGEIFVAAARWRYWPPSDKAEAS
jgi:hypothetical protein